METSLQKIKKGTSHYISIADWPHKSHSVFYNQAGTATTMFDMPDTLYHGGVMVKAMHCGIVVREFVLKSRYYVHFRANTLGKGMDPLILPPAMGK